jgi:hypothetical protein
MSNTPSTIVSEATVQSSLNRKYLEDILANLRHTEPLTRLDPDTRTPELEREVSRSRSAVETLQDRIEAVCAELASDEAEYSRVLLTDAAAAKVHLISVQVSKDVIRTLEAELKAAVSKIEGLVAEKQTIASARARIEENNRLTELSNSAKREASVLIDSALNSLMQLRTVFGQLSKSPGVSEAERKTMFVIEACFREWILKPLSKTDGRIDDDFLKRDRIRQSELPWSL